MKRVGIDIGGTFTDLVFWDDESAKMVIHKLPSTPDDPARAGVKGLIEICAKAGAEPSEIDAVFHGTTVATNILLEKNGAKTGLITTHGFRDILHIGRKNRPFNFSHYQDIPRQNSPLVQRRHRETVRERITAPNGDIETPLNEEDVRAAARRLKSVDGLDSIAIACLFSFLNPAHEIRIKEIVEEEFPEAYISASHQVAPLYREYERFSTTALNAYVGPKTAQYIERFANTLKNGGFKSQLRLMTSAGGVVSAAKAKQTPVSLLLSGPVGALIAGIETGRQAGYPNVITLDVGGTSADIGVAPNGELRLKHLLDTQIGDYDAMTPMADLDTIGAGGGSIAFVDEGGMFQVGPRSAGADPGPASYGRGGVEPTVTDAIVAMNWYRAEALREAGLDLNESLAEQAIVRKIADPLGLSLEEAAVGIYRIVANNMAEAVRLNSVAKGFDPRDFALLSYGGAGAAFAVEVARLLSIPAIIIPPHAGVGAAGGLLSTNMKYDFQKTLWRRLDETDPKQIKAAYEPLAKRARDQLGNDGFNGERSVLKCWAECRYEGQGYELRVEAPDGDIDDLWINRITENFHAVHERTYTRRFDEKPVMIVNIGVTGIGAVGRLTQPRLGRSENSAPKPVAEGIALFPTTDGVVQVPTKYYARSSLGSGAVLHGPAIIEQPDTTVVLPPDVTATVDSFGNIIVAFQDKAIS